MKKILFLALLLLCSCSAISKFTDKIGTAIEFGQKLRDDVGKIKEKFDDKVATITAKLGDVKAKFEAMDTDNDGNVSIAEMIAGLTVLAGAGVARNAASAREKARILAAAKPG